VVICFFCKVLSYTKKKTFYGDFSIGCGAHKLPQKSMDEKSSSFVAQVKSVVIHEPQIGDGGSKGLTLYILGIPKWNLIEKSLK
jgi:hypothetical protein